MDNDGNFIHNHDQMPPASFSQPPQPSYSQPPHQPLFSHPPQPLFSQPPQPLFSHSPQPSFSQPPQPSDFLPPSLPYSEQLGNFWTDKIESMVNLKAHAFPIARMRKIMKSEPDVHMVSAEAPVMLAKACEMFITDLTMRSWFHASENNRNTLQRSDMSAAVAATPEFDFLEDIVPREETTAAAAEPDFSTMPNPDGVGVPYYYQYPSGMVNGSFVDGEETAEGSGGNGDLN